MTLDKLDNLLISACKKAKLVRIKTYSNSIVLCENFVKTIESAKRFYLLFENAQHITNIEEKTNFYIAVDNIKDIEFLFLNKIKKPYLKGFYFYAFFSLPTLSIFNISIFC